MQRLGKALNVTPSNSIIIKTENPPKIGCEVANENLTVIGKIFDTIGPVSSPYAVIKTNIKNPATLLNKPLYLLPPKTRGKR
ncbi:MAG: Gar1/Naf1 family protein [Nitrososphaerota archaeon]|jgi:RNA-binding protein|uniref:H/ACA ribonucleoprotein complex subunit GAR1 n=1 Tax=Candidatus Bathycorpusculum sp. TaxID=2994959 RepID=UPI0028290443|nr:Gar1/Naf1 family protein [Candidatus Termiticorpusculum sp.]MCL2257266.1 Gar1/Naf1 family protein [Candidatus Termiticorpusculum sp.]MCL2292599.1 Gar1/Naf1 family protein [Candidatus Termiticorpusculum sp.]MDR0460182.1 Gar1/Naf1 family protein [Nitrososphaerota archaeon]